MKRILTLLLALTMVFALCACREKELTDAEKEAIYEEVKEKKAADVDGSYYLTKFMYNGWNIADSYSDSEIFINGVDANTLSYIKMASSNSTGYVYGPVTTEMESSSMIEYKFWVNMKAGDFFSDDMKYIYLYYYPEKGTIEANAASGITLTFQKSLK